MFFYSYESPENLTEDLLMQVAKARAKAEAQLDGFG